MKLPSKSLTLLTLFLTMAAVLHGCGNKTEGAESNAGSMHGTSGDAASNSAITSTITSNSPGTQTEVKESLYKLYPALTGEIDIYEEKVRPAKRNFKAKWDEKIFYGLENIKGSKKGGRLRSYEVLRKNLINKKSKNRIEYEIYRNPKTGKINKIVSIEYREKDLELTDYYYTDEGKVNFIYQRKDGIYTPTYASPNKTGSRYYFDKDCMLKWRWVDKPNDVRERVLEKDKEGGRKVQYLYKKSKKEDRKNYDKKEIKMLNAAYNTYEAMLKENDYTRITGNIVNTKGKALKDVKIEIYFGEELIGEIKTDGKGHYETGITPNKEGYKLKIAQEGFAETEIENVMVADTGKTILINTIVLVKSEEGKKKLKFTVFNAEATKYSNKKAVKEYVDTVLIKVRKGIDNKVGEVIAEGRSDSKGNINLELENGVYTIELVKEGFVKTYQTIVVENKLAMNIPLIKKMKRNQLKIVLTWEGDKDIDSCLFTPYQGKDGDMAYVGAGTKRDKHGNSLVLDGKQGNTTEVIVIDNVKAGNYKYYVSDYTNSRKKKFSSTDMKKLKLKVSVYDETGVVGCYTLPYDVNGIIWEVFEIINGKLIPLQKTYSNVKGKKWWTKDKLLMSEKAAIEKKRLDEIRKFERVVLPAYESYVRNNFPEIDDYEPPYSFIYLNDDYIPELVVRGKYSVTGNLVCTYVNGVVAINTARSSIGYIERKNLLLNPGGNTGCYYDKVYSIINGKFVCVGNGDYVEDFNKNGVYKYYWDSIKVSEKDYRAKLSKVIGNNSMGSGEFIYAPTIREAYMKFKATKGR